MKKSIWLIFLIIVIICAVVFFVFQKNMSKVLKNGNNMSSQEIVDYILSISSYKANVTVNINSNKNFNKYILNQEYISPNTNNQEIIEPEIIIIEKEKEEKKPNCVICMSEEAKIILCPCGHKCVCEACFNSINSRYPKRCPMCRKNFIGKIDHVFTP